jgi:hypothetical protein
MNLHTHKALKTFSIPLATLFILAQFIFKMTSSGGGWCSPYLGAPVELGHPAYQFADYGFPLPFVTAVKADCFTAQSTTYEWSPIGLGIDGLLLALLAYPVWSGFVRKKSIIETNSA